jgi:K+-transporting ATPase ATPase A chain
MAADFIGASLIFIIAVLLALPMGSLIYTHYPGGSEALGWLSNKGAHGFTTMYYEYVFCMAGNGSEFSGLNNNTPFWNLTTFIPMLPGRYVPVIGAFAIIGSYQAKKYVAPSFGTLKTESYTFGAFLFSVILVLSVLSMFIVLITGPIIEQYVPIKL